MDVFKMTNEEYHERVLKLGEICALKSKLISVGDPSYTDEKAVQEIKLILSEAFRSKLSKLEKLDEDLKIKLWELEAEKMKTYSEEKVHKLLVHLNDLEREYQSRYSQ